MRARTSSGSTLKIAFNRDGYRDGEKWDSKCLITPLHPQFARQSFAMHTTLLSVRAGRVTNGRVSPADTIIQNWDRAMGHKKLYITHLFMTVAAACTHAQRCINCCVRPLDKSVNSNVKDKLLQMHETKQTNKKCPGLTPHSISHPSFIYICVCSCKQLARAHGAAWYWVGFVNSVASIHHKPSRGIAAQQGSTSPFKLKVKGSNIIIRSIQFWINMALYVLFLS